MTPMSDAQPIITLLTDFGDHDGYVGVMKGVILSITPDARLVDITHQIAPQDIHEAAVVLSSAYPYFPPHTVHLVVVDPGVGSTRRPIAVETPRGRFVAPDNGVLSYVLLAEPSFSAVALEDPRYHRPNPSHTFHGRDIFSPVAAHLARGVGLAELGPRLDDLVRLPLPALTITPQRIEGEVVRIDRFGNARTNIMRLEWDDPETLTLRPLAAGQGPLTFQANRAQITFSWHRLEGIKQTYSAVGVGQPLALVGSSGELEIAVNQGSASSALAIKPGDPVTVQINP
ncbi:MAG: hypothetical protein Kow00124_07780 [Anaerolineae bacterium]